MSGGDTNQIDWSYSASRVYESCPRQFYYQYKSRTESVDRSNTATEAKETGNSVSSLGALIGTVVHDCIETQIDRWACGDRLSLQAAQEHATDRLESALDTDTQQEPAPHSPSNDETDSDQDIQSLVRTTHTHIENFFQIIWPQFDGHRYILHEVSRSFSIAGDTVWVKPDLCTRNRDGDFVITDWKTTSPDQLSPPSAQKLVYALWAHREYEPTLDRIQVRLVHTRDGNIDSTRPDMSDIAHIKDRIQTELMEWRSRSTIDEYPPDPTVEKCRSCSALTYCPPGQKYVSD